jgi:hypothetical protein
MGAVELKNCQTKFNVIVEEFNRNIGNMIEDQVTFEFAHPLDQGY